MLKALAAIILNQNLLYRFFSVLRGFLSFSSHPTYIFKKYFLQKHFRCFVVRNIKNFTKIKKKQQQLNTSVLRNFVVQTISFL